MDQDSVDDTDTGLAAQAFLTLRGEVSLLRRGIERLTDEWVSQPDYGPTLEAVSKRVTNIDIWAERIAGHPALKLTPDSLAREISAAAANSRGSDRDMLRNAADLLKDAGSRIDDMIARSRSAREQNQELLRNRIGFTVAGMMLCAILPGAIARSLPVRWAVPERIAARMLGKDMWKAGQDMMAKADPERWDGIVERERERALRLSGKPSSRK